MKITSKRLVSILLCLAFALAVLPVAAFAASATTIYVQPNSNWLDADARFAAYFFGDGELWLDMTDADGDGNYEVAVPDGYTGVIFCRMNPETTENNWENKWNQTADLTVPTDDKVVYVVDGWDNGNGQWIEVGGEPEEIEVVYYLRGTMNGWDTSTPLTDNGDGTWSVTVDIAAGTYEYKIGDAGWGSAWPSENATLNVTSDCAVTFTLDVNANTVTATGDGVSVPDTGSDDNGAGDTNTGNTNTGDTNTGDTNTGAGNTSTGDNTNTGNTNTGDTNTSTGDNTSTGNTNTGDTSTNAPATEPPVLEGSLSDYRVTGNTDWLGNWDAANESGRMTQVSENVYKIVYTNVPAGDYQFKVTNGTWDSCWGGNGPDGNYELSTSTEGYIVISFDASNGYIYVEGEAIASQSNGNPQTGDVSMVGLVVLMVLASAAVVVISGKKKFF